MKKKLLLINPAQKDNLHANIKALAIPPLNLAMVAAYTPDDRYEMKIVDEFVEDLDLNEHADLVGITCMTPLAPRAYEIAGHFRKRGIPVVMGGIHASYRPEEALHYVDTVVSGEAEGIWPKVIEDFEKGQLQKLYKVEELPDITHLKPARRDLFRGKYTVQTIQTGRGCPINCNFCSVTAFNGPRYRLRDLDSVIAEIKTIKSKNIFIVDDNIVGSGNKYIKRARELFTRLKECGKEWGAQTCLNIVEHDDLLKLAHASGCRGFLIGFESIDADSLNLMHKPVNLRPNTKNFSESIRKIHDHGIAIVGCFIFGADTQTKDVFKRTVDFALANNIDAIQMTLETPLPGTAFYRQMEAENRLLLTDYPNDWKHYNIFEPVFQMKSFSPREAYESLVDAYREMSALKTSLKRAWWTFRNTRSLFSTAIAFSWNYHAYKTIQHTPTPLAMREGMVMKKARPTLPVRAA